MTTNNGRNTGRATLCAIAAVAALVPSAMRSANALVATGSCAASWGTNGGTYGACNYSIIAVTIPNGCIVYTASDGINAYGQTLTTTSTSYAGSGAAPTSTSAGGVTWCNDGALCGTVPGYDLTASSGTGVTDLSWIAPPPPNPWTPQQTDHGNYTISCQVRYLCSNGAFHGTLCTN